MKKFYRKFKEILENFEKNLKNDFEKSFSKI